MSIAAPTQRAKRTRKKTKQLTIQLFGFFKTKSLFVRLTGLEPARRETLDPKSNASTNSATSAFRVQN